MVLTVTMMAFRNKLAKTDFAQEGVSKLKSHFDRIIVFKIWITQYGYQTMWENGEILEHDCRKYGMQAMNGWQMVEWGRWLAKNLSCEHRHYILCSHHEGGESSYGLGSGGNIVFSGTGGTTMYYVQLDGYHPEVEAWYVWDFILKKYRWYNKQGQVIPEPEKIAEKRLKKW